MRKVGAWAVMAILALCWIRTISYGLFQGHYIALILCIIILAPVTARVVWGYLAMRSAEKEAQSRAEEAIANPCTHPAAPKASPERFCTYCGAKNTNGKFCVECGKPL